MQEGESGQLEKALRLQAGRVGFEAVAPTPKFKLLDQMREVLRLRHYSILTEQAYCDWMQRQIRFGQPAVDAPGGFGRRLRRDLRNSRAIPMWPTR